jgi:hypothetical protein
MANAAIFCIHKIKQFLKEEDKTKSQVKRAPRGTFIEAIFKEAKLRGTPGYKKIHFSF